MYIAKQITTQVGILPQGGKVLLSNKGATVEQPARFQIFTEVEVIDPLDGTKSTTHRGVEMNVTVEQLQERIADFQAKVDACLGVKNTIETKIQA